MCEVGSGGQQTKALLDGSGYFIGNSFPFIRAYSALLFLLRACMGERPRPAQTYIEASLSRRIASLYSCLLVTPICVHL